MFKRTKLANFPDVKLSGVCLADIYAEYAEGGRLDYTTPRGRNRIIVTGEVDPASLRNTRIHFGGINNLIVIDGLAGVAGLDIACIKRSRIELQAPVAIQGLTIVASHRCKVEIHRDCLVSRDVLIYASRDHGLYDVSDGQRRDKNHLVVNEHVWIGQGARILNGSDIGPGAVIGSYSIVAGRIPNNCAAAGNPCRVTRRDIFWDKEDGVDNYFRMLDIKGKPKPDFVRYTEGSEQRSAPEASPKIPDKGAPEGGSTAALQAAP